MSSFGPEDGPQSLDLVCNMLPARQDHQPFACKALSDQHSRARCALKLLDHGALLLVSFVWAINLCQDHAFSKAHLQSKLAHSSWCYVACFAGTPRSCCQSWSEYLVQAFWVVLRWSKAESSQKKHSCCISDPPIKMLVWSSMITSSSPEKMFGCTLFCPKPMFLSCSSKASCEQASLALVVVISHWLLKLSVSKILTLRFCRSVLPKLFCSSFSATISSSSMILGFSKLLSWVVAGFWPCCSKLLWDLSWEAFLAAGFFFFLLLAPFSGQAVVVPKFAVFLACCSLRFSRGKLSS